MKSSYTETDHSDNLPCKQYTEDSKDNKLQPALDNYNTRSSSIHYITDLIANNNTTSFKDFNRKIPDTAKFNY